MHLRTALAVTALVLAGCSSAVGQATPSRSTTGAPPTPTPPPNSLVISGDRIGLLVGTHSQCYVSPAELLWDGAGTFNGGSWQLGVDVAGYHGAGSYTGSADLSVDTGTPAVYRANGSAVRIQVIASDVATVDLTLLLDGSASGRTVHVSGAYRCTVTPWTPGP